MSSGAGQDGPVLFPSFHLLPSHAQIWELLGTVQHASILHECKAEQNQFTYILQVAVPRGFYPQPLPSVSSG